MDQFIIFILAIIAVILTIIFALQNYRKQTDTEDAHKTNRGRRYWRRPNNYVRIATLIAVAGYTGISLWQVTILKATERRQLRGYLGITDMQFDCGDCLPTEDDQIWAVSNNFGQSPLYVINGMIWHTEYKIEEEFPEGDVHRSPVSIADLIPRSIVIYPKNPVNMNFPVNDITKPLYWEAENGDYWIMIRGFIRYRDIFDEALSLCVRGHKIL